uniref:Uncharacterized LOC115385896 n=1 Tax=Salarias fasciatus TaxID=181472 RepID=A0A672IK04_SALFA
MTAVSAACAVHSLTNIVGYIGESVTLPSRVEPSWVLNKIEWAIYPNNTWIATYREQTESLNRVPRYKGRLRLNTTTGDLTISNLNLNDAMEYSVDLSSDSENTVNKINLVQPVITQRQIITKSSCVVLLTCRSANQGADLSWSSTSFQGDNATLSTPDGLQLIFYTNSTQKASEFTCTSTVGSATASSDFTATCYGL